MAKILYSLGLLCALPLIVLGADKCHTSELFKCYDIAIKWIDSLPKNSIAHTEEQVDTMCQELSSLIECENKFIETCTTPLQKEVIALVSEGGEAFVQNFCSSNSDLKTKYLQHAPCLNKVVQDGHLKEIINFVMAAVEQFNKIPDNKKILYACCAYSKTYNHIMTLGASNCGDDAMESAKEVLTALLAQLPDVVCQGFTGTEPKCEEILPSSDAKPSDAAKQTELYKYIFSAFKNYMDKKKK